MTLTNQIIVVILGYLGFTAWTCSAETLTFEVPNRDKFCFYEVFKSAEKYTFEYAVLRGGEVDIDVRVKAPGGAILYDQTKVKQAKFDFDSTIGEYEVCFSNEFSRFSHKVVYFTLEPYRVRTLEEDAGWCHFGLMRYCLIAFLILLSG